MSKIIRMTPEMIQEATERFAAQLKRSNIVDGKISYSETFKATGQKAVVWFTPDAYAKMVALIQDSDKEVAWHGVAHRVDDQVGQYVITDILVYPQEVTGATVNTDQEEYEMWMMQQEDDVFNNIRMQGHSHVRMETHPSPTDLEHQAKIVEQLEGDMFYIFMIWNKYFKYTAKIYDLQINTLFEPSDISVMMVGSRQGLEDFLKEARSMVKTKTYNYQSYQGTGYQSGYQGSYNGSYNQNKPATTQQSSQSTVTASTKDEKKNENSGVPSRPKGCIGKGWGGANGCDNNYDYDDADDPYGRYH